MKKCWRRARDTQVGRDVAIKILPEAFAADSDRVARFEREAQVLAWLNHPNIAQIYGLERQGGRDGQDVRALVLELVEAHSPSPEPGGDAIAPDRRPDHFFCHHSADIINPFSALTRLASPKR